jgi:hypothetical protein
MKPDSRKHPNDPPRGFTPLAWRTNPQMWADRAAERTQHECERVRLLLHGDQDQNA